jgi:heme b synthase
MSDHHDHQEHQHPGNLGQAEPYVPRLIAWEVTRACLLNCKHCRASASREVSADEFTTAECFSFLDNVASFSKPIIILTGGEPMLREDIYDIAAHAHGLGLPVVMAPCGLLLNDETAAKIVKSGVRRISLSLDGATAESHDAFRGFPGSFDAVLAGIEAAKRAGLDFQINTTVSQHNIAELPAILGLALRLGASVFNPFLLVPTGRGKDLLGQELSAEQYEKVLQGLAAQQSRKDIQIRVTCAPHYQRILRQCVGPVTEGHASKGCLGGKSFAFVSHIGKVQICGFLDTECGDLRREKMDFHKIWTGSEVFAQVRDVDHYRGRCGVCEFRRVCGGCRARAHAVVGDYLAEEPFCTYKPKRVAQVSNLCPPGNAEAKAGNLSRPGHPGAQVGNLCHQAELDDVDRKVLLEAQLDFPILRHPYESLGERLHLPAADVLERIRRLKEAGVIRRIGGVFSTARLGYASTLVAAKVAPDRLEAVAAEVSRIEGVTHNYAREHAYNLWFTLTARSRDELAGAVAELRGLAGVEDLQPLPTTDVYKTSAVFRLGASRAAGTTGVPPVGLRHRAEMDRRDACPTKKPVVPPVTAAPSGGALSDEAETLARDAGHGAALAVVQLDESQKALVRLVQESLPLDNQPLVSLAREWGRPVEILIVQLRRWLADGVMRRFGAVLSHRRVGLLANGMAMLRVPPGRAEEVGALLSARDEVSHCYRRQVPANWSGDMFAMVHGRDREGVLQIVRELAAQAGVQDYQVLFSTVEYKKTSMRFFLETSPARQ